MRAVFLFIVSIINKPKVLYKRLMFEKNALMGKMIRIGPIAYCQNQTGIKSKVTIGSHCDIDARICVNGKNASIKIGDYTTIRYNSVVGAVEKIEIGNHVIISNHVTIYDNNNHPTDPEERIKMCESGFYSEMWKWEHSVHSPVTIEDNVWIGEYATILKGVTIGKGSVVGCHAVVTKSVEPYTIVAGNPAREVKKLKPPV